ncbi:hypothetical protein QCA50_015703 [Cerrena zonata]|uniref:Uncharacterized protein n=1 Tax=Cerrena zonata TaxID=2478898 RepID=A0AAW0FIR4_9APHY
MGYETSITSPEQNGNEEEGAHHISVSNSNGDTNSDDLNKGSGDADEPHSPPSNLSSISLPTAGPSSSPHKNVVDEDNEKKQSEDEREQDPLYQEMLMISTKVPRRVKVYLLQGEDWLDNGTGYCTGEFSEDTHKPYFFVRSELHPQEVILKSYLEGSIQYQRQQETLIVWTDLSGKDLALSFQETEGCADLCEFIIKVQQQGFSSDISLYYVISNASISDNDGNNGGVNEITELITGPINIPEDPTIDNLESIIDVISQGSNSQYTRSCILKFIIEKQDVSLVNSIDNDNSIDISDPPSMSPAAAAAAAATNSENGNDKNLIDKDKNFGEHKPLKFKLSDDMTLSLILSKLLLEDKNPGLKIQAFEALRILLDSNIASNTSIPGQFEGSNGEPNMKNVQNGFDLEVLRNQFSNFQDEFEDEEGEENRNPLNRGSNEVNDINTNNYFEAFYSKVAPGLFKELSDLSYSKEDSKLHESIVSKIKGDEILYQHLCDLISFCSKEHEAYISRPFFLENNILLGNFKDICRDKINYVSTGKELVKMVENEFYEDDTKQFGVADTSFDSEDDEFLNNGHNVSTPIKSDEEVEPNELNENLPLSNGSGPHNLFEDIEKDMGHKTHAKRAREDDNDSELQPIHKKETFVSVADLLKSVLPTSVLPKSNPVSPTNDEPA